MIQTLYSFIPVGIVVLAFLVLWFAVNLRKRRFLKLNRRSPLTRNMLRTPGESLRSEIEEIKFDNNCLATIYLISPFLMYSICITQLYALPKTNLVTSLFFGGILVFTAWAFTLRKFFQNAELIRRKQLGLEGELSLIHI